MFDGDNSVSIPTTPPPTQAFNQTKTELSEPSGLACPVGSRTYQSYGLPEDLAVALAKYQPSIPVGSSDAWEYTLYRNRHLSTTS
ncbi:hypothetical protein SCAR479_06237 [Seiridium cardinale]|uniref:Uncharacterized protein n=1 Tax=Seiridium cardinale TaxID=138064 RepID=A0ABR2XTM5_9PEZI